MRVEPSRNFMIRAGKRVREGQGHAILGEKEGGCHKKASKINPHLIPVKRENARVRYGGELLNPTMQKGCTRVANPRELPNRHASDAAFA